MDAGRQWIQSYASERPMLAAALMDDSVRKRSKRIVRAWRQACELRVAELRRTKAIREQMGLSHVHRIGTELMRALVTQHSTFACFLSEPLDGLQRWQMFVILITLGAPTAARSPACAAPDPCAPAVRQCARSFW